jgi:hypothetical protein
LSAPIREGGNAKSDGKCTCSFDRNLLDRENTYHYQIYDMEIDDAKLLGFLLFSICAKDVMVVTFLKLMQQVI